MFGKPNQTLTTLLASLMELVQAGVGPLPITNRQSAEALRPVNTLYFIFTPNIQHKGRCAQKQPCHSPSHSEQT